MKTDTLTLLAFCLFVLTALLTSGCARNSSQMDMGSTGMESTMNEMRNDASAETLRGLEEKKKVPGMDEQMK